MNRKKYHLNQYSQNISRLILHVFNQSYPGVQKRLFSRNESIEKTLSEILNMAAFACIFLSSEIRISTRPNTLHLKVECLSYHFQ